MNYWEFFVLINGLIYIWLIANQNRLGWVFGVLSCSGQIYVSYKAKLYLDCGLNVFYIVLGVIGFVNWGLETSSNFYKKLKLKEWIYIMFFGIFISLLCALMFKKLGNASPYLDAFTTVFSIIATFLTIKKYIENWFFWIFIDFALAYLFYIQELKINASLYFIYFIVAIYGWKQWKNQLR